jgi:phage terminase small subunit
MPELDNPQHEKFCLAYVSDFNATQAAIKAGYSKKTAASQASRLLTTVKIQLRVKELTRKSFQRLEITSDRIRQEYAKIAFFNPKSLFDEHGRMKAVSELDDDDAAAIAAVEVGVEFDDADKPKKKKKKKGEDDDPLEDEADDILQPRTAHEFIRKVKISDKKAALDSLAKLEGMFVDRLEHTGKDGAPLAPPPMTDTELARKMAFLLAAAAEQQKQAQQAPAAPAGDKP